MRADGAIGASAAVKQAPWRLFQQRRQRCRHATKTAPGVKNAANMVLYLLSPSIIAPARQSIEICEE